MKIGKMGVTLIELLIVLAIISMVAMVSINSYQQYVRRGKRLDAIADLLAMSMAEERYRSTHTQYGSLASVWQGVTASSSGYYTLSISNVSASTYTLTATGLGTQASDTVNGATCATLTLSMSSGTLSKTPAACWAS